MENIISNKNFVFTGNQPWDIPIGSNAKDIALEVSKNNRVLYINTPLDIITYYKSDNIQENIVRRSIVRNKSNYVKKINENLFTVDLPFTILPINSIPDGKIYDFFNKLNNKKIYSFVNKIIKELNFEDHILFIDNDFYRSFYAKEYLKSKFSIYYRRDNFRSPFWLKHCLRFEKEICKNSDIVLSNSEELSEYSIQYQPKTYCIGQGVDLSNYSIKTNYERPSDLINITGPIIGYAGMLTAKRLDLKLIYDLAVYFDKINFVYVGPKDEEFSKHDINNLKNVHFLGHKDIKEIPAYISNFDICINPQLINEVTIGNYPRKIDEYLALGKPIVATNTRTMNIFKDYCYNCDNIEDYIDAIKAILYNKQELGTPDEKLKFAFSHTWENSVGLLYKYIIENINSK